LTLRDALLAADPGAWPWPAPPLETYVPGLRPILLNLLRVHQSALSVGVSGLVAGRYRTFTTAVDSQSPTRRRVIGSLPGVSYSPMPSPSRMGAI